MLIPHVRDIDVDSTGEFRHVEQVPAVLRNEAVNERDVGPVVHESAGKVGADEAEPTGDQDPFAREDAHSPARENRKPR